MFHISNRFLPDSWSRDLFRFYETCTDWDVVELLRSQWSELHFVIMQNVASIDSAPGSVLLIETDDVYIAVGRMCLLMNQYVYPDS